MTEHYDAQVRQQLAQARTEAARYRAAWKSARGSATDYSTAVDLVRTAGERGVADLGRIAHDQLTRAEKAEAERDGAYRERAHLVAWLAALHPAVITPAPDIDEPGWHILYLNITPDSQASWHIAPSDADLFKRVEHVNADDPRAQWDGHTTPQKYQRIRHHTTVVNLLSGGHAVDPATRAGVAEARIAAAHRVVDRFDEYLLRRDAVADLRDALNGTVSEPCAGRECAGSGCSHERAFAELVALGQEIERESS